VASLNVIQASRRLILDAGAILAFRRGDVRARAKRDRALGQGFVAAIPTPVLAQVHRGGRDRARTDRVLKAVGAFVPTSVDTARRAGELLGRSGLTDAIDGIVAAEALRAVPSVILTSDPDDMERLIEGQPESRRVLIIGV
jgi:hypothetical protein